MTDHKYLYVVYRYSDYKKENNAEVLAVCKCKDKALEIMEQEIDKYIKKYEIERVELSDDEDYLRIEGWNGEQIFRVDKIVYYK